MTFALTRTLIVGIGGVLIGAVLAYLLSPLTPVGEARLADPSAGFAFDRFVILVGAAIGVVLVLALGAWPAIRTARIDHRGETSRVFRPSQIAALLAGVGAPPTALIGIRHALERDRRRNAAPVGSALVGSILAVAALGATVVFGAGLTHLTRTPPLYGEPFDLAFVTTGPPSAAHLERLVDLLKHDEAISDITIGAGEDVRVNGRSVNAIATQAYRGHLLITKVGGRFPGTADEVALGAATLRQVGAHIGSLVQVRAPVPQGGTRTSSYRVVGTTVFPPDFGAAGLGTGALFTLHGLLGAPCPQGPTQMACEVHAVIGDAGSFLVRAMPGPRGRAALSELARALPEEVNYRAAPTNLINFGESVDFPLIFALVLVVFGAATLVQLLVIGVSRRRREIGLLKTLGFVRRQVAFSVWWQATTVALFGSSSGCRPVSPSVEWLGALLPAISAFHQCWSSALRQSCWWRQGRCSSPTSSRLVRQWSPPDRAPQIFSRPNEAS